MIGRSLSHYRITGELGAGGMGEVWRAEDEKLGREVALKVLPADFAGDLVRLARFEREARAASALNHPNICSIFDIGEWEDRRFIVMELLEGHSLDQHIGTQPMEVEVAVDLAIQMAEALAAAHAKGIIHRDMKPENVYLVVDKDGTDLCKILDFGIARRLDDLEMSASGATGTPFYMAPEQIRGQPPTPATDIYSFGATAFHLATGRPPFHTGNVIDAHLSEPAPDPVDLVPDLEPELGRIILRCLEKEPEDRYPDTGELCADLEALCR